MISVPYNTEVFDHPEVPLPALWTVRHHVEAPVLADVDTATQDAVSRVLASGRAKPGASIAVGVGSRGIDNLAVIVGTVIAALKSAGLRPFIVPAMGSHGGATAAGQKEILAGYGITEAAMGVPVRATMEVVRVGSLDDGYPVYFDANAAAADAVIVINRIKHHTDFSGEIESGLAKMCAIGLGKQKGAASIHRFGAQGLRHTMPRVARRLIHELPIIGGVAIVENPYGRTAEIHGLVADEIGQEREKELLQRARALAPRLAFDSLDVLVVDEMGKDISGSGMDTHVIGRVRMPSIDETEWDGPKVRLLAVLGLTENTHGNAAGFGLADMTTRRLVEQMDHGATEMNHRTSGEGGVLRHKMPMVLETPAACIRAAISMCGHGDWSKVRLARIRDTEHVDTLEVSEPLLDEVRSRPDLEIVADAHVPDFDAPLARAR